MTSSNGKGLVRVIGRWSLTALVINSIIGSGIFGLPAPAARLLGIRSPLAVLLAGLAVAPIIACYAEVSSYFTQAGGPYLWTRTAFGPLIGLETGWLLWLVRLTAPAANANLFVSYLAEFWPSAKDPLPRAAVLSLHARLEGVEALGPERPHNVRSDVARSAAHQPRHRSRLRPRRVRARLINAP